VGENVLDDIADLLQLIVKLMEPCLYRLRMTARAAGILIKP